MLMASKNRDTETPPKMLKEFLQELNNNHHPRRHPNTLPRTRSSRSRAAVTSFQKLISSAIKSLRRRSSTSSLPRSLSTGIFDRFSVNKKNKYTSTNNDKVKVKDILRWRSSRDLVEEASQPPAVAVDDESISISTSSDTGDVFGSLFGSESSLAEKEESCFTADELPSWWENSCEEGKLWDQDNDVGVTVSHVGSKEELDNMTTEDGKEQHSPVSVLNSPFREEIDSPFSEEVSDEEFVSSFDKSLANMERTKQRLLQSILSFESLAGVFEDDDETEILEAEQEQERGDDVRIVDNDIEIKSREYLSRARGKITWKGQGLKDREDGIKYTEEEQGQWSKFEEEKRELGVEFQVQVLSDLVNEILIDYSG